MPIYEYRCRKCGAVKTVYAHSYKDPDDLVCDGCGGRKLKRIISKVNYHQSQSDRLASYDPKSRNLDSFMRDSRNIGLHAEHMLQKAGVKPTEDFQNKLDNLRADPSRVLKDE
ncbi:MAG TPA: zinc ribbon domain-containing protein [Deltaproteobacteria bacterium]|jgi:putative FmdB family regulatory protein|nr:zinc ribbon domain-containing protein [Deltaproteobacteria bacterium]HOI05863.1 zinc ribbon domain-containing protein [Deltaproteobacteria bacterium]